MCLLSPDEIQFLLLTHLQYDEKAQELEIDQAELALSLSDHTV